MAKPRKLRVVSKRGQVLTLRWSGKHKRYLFAPSTQRGTGPTGWTGKGKARRS